MFVKILTIKNKKIVEELNLDYCYNLVIYAGINIKINVFLVIVIYISLVII